MARYIDAEKATEYLLEHKRIGLENCIVLRADEDAIIKFINEKCETADVQEVVRCKDCIHRDPEDKKCEGAFCAKNGLLPMDDNDYCSYGDRKDGDKE